MAQLLTSGGYIQCRMWSTLGNQAAVNSFWYVVSSVGTSPATDQDLADERDATLGPLYKPLLTNGAIYNGVQVAQHSTVPPKYRTTTVPVQAVAQAGHGTAGVDGLSPQTCGLIKFITDFGGVANRGRMYLPFPSTVHSSAGGSPTSAYVALALAFADQVYAGLALSTGGRTAVLVRVILHRTNKAGVDTVPTPVQDRFVSNLWATQRKRSDFGRPNVSPI